MEVLTIARVVHDGALDGYTALLGIEVDDVIKQRGVPAVQEADKLFHALIAVEGLSEVVALFVFLSEVGQRDAYAFVQIGQLAQTGLQSGVFIYGSGKNATIRPEGLLGAGESRFAGANLLYTIEGLTAAVLLLVDLTIAEYLSDHAGGEGIHTRYAYAVQTA